MSENKDKKVILFSTRFLETEDKLFCEDNIDSPEYCCSPEYLKYFLSDNLPSEIVQYFNRLYYKSFFSHYKDEDGKSIINVEDNSKEIREKLWGNIPEVKYSKPLWMSFFSDLDKEEKLFEIVVNKERAKFELKDKEVDVKGLLKLIQDFEDTVHNRNIIFNTDFGESADKRTIDRRFKIYKLRETENKPEVYGVWCLRDASNGADWYQALYKELEAQMGDDFKSVTDIMYFLHDGDIGEKKPFEIKHYKEGKKTFGFLDEKKSLSVAIFQHSLSSIATVLSTTNIDIAIEKAIKEMEKGGKRTFLNNLSDYIAYWPSGGKEKYMKDVMEEREKYGLNTLLSGENDKVEDVYKEVKSQIDNL